MPSELNIREWQRCLPGEPPAGFSELAKRWLDSQATQRAAEALTSSGMLEIVERREGLSVRSTSWVGQVQVDDLIINIAPKIEHMPLMRLLQYGYRLRDLRLFDESTVAVEALNFVDVLIHQLLTEVTELLSRGLHRAYIREESRLAVPRGRIDLRRIAMEGFVRTEIPCGFHLRSEDVLMNQVLRSGLELAASLCKDINLRRRTHQLAARMAEYVSLVRLSSSVFAQVRRSMTRLSAAYEPALRLVAILASGHGMSLDAGDQTVIAPGFLFDMNRLWQAVLSRLLHEGLPDIEVRDEYVLNGVLAYEPGFKPPGRSAPSIRPDFVLFAHGHASVVLDAKYIDLWANAPGRDVIYQLAMYALSQGNDGEATILYPAPSSVAREARIVVHDVTTSTRRALIVLRPVHLACLDKVIGPDSTVGARRDFARTLVYGNSA